MAKLVKLLDLESFDNGQHRPPFLVPVGETVIGRGEFLKCKSTEVSRSHALLKADKDGNLILTTSNKKPCYYKKCGNADKTMLKENETVQLQHGDVFSLTVLSSGYEVQVSDDLSSVSPEEKDSKELDPKISDVGETAKVHVPQTSKRKFPSWMEDSDDENESPERKKTSEEKKASVDDTKQESCLGLSSTSEYDQGSKQNTNEGAEVGFELNNDDLTSTNNDTNNIQNPVPVNCDSDKSNDTFFDPNEEQDKVDDEDKDAEVAVNQSTLDVPSTAQVTSPQRPLCMYADKCYRKNPQHKADFCHPGDPDYQTQQTTTNAPSKQICPYGTSCYRVNPQHKRDFDHTQPPVSTSQTPTKQSPRKTRQKKKTDKKKTAAHWESGSDESYDGSFIDDDENSSDDYRPDDDTESDNEDWD